MHPELGGGGEFSYLEMTNDSYSDKEADQVMAISPV